MALYFYFNETTGDLVYSDQAAYDAEGYASLGQQEKMEPFLVTDWVFHSKRASIKTVTKDPSLSGRVNVLTSMSSMFSNCRSLTSFDLSGFDMSVVTSMSSMFYNCSGLTSLDLSGFNTSAVTNMSRMFSSCSSLASLDLSGFDTSAVTDMSYMFSDCSGLTGLDLSNFDTSTVTDMSNMFNTCRSLTNLNLSSFDTSAVTNMGSMFYLCGDLTSLDLSSFDTSAVKTMSYMFYGCGHLTGLDLSGFDTSAVTDMSGMFEVCARITNLDLSSFDTSAVTQMGRMFRNCPALTSLDLSSLDTSNVTYTSNMFADSPAIRIVDISPNMSNVLPELPADTYYDAVTRQPYAKADIPGGETYVRDLADLDLVATMVQTRMGIDVAKRLAQRALRKVNVSSSGGTGGVDVPFPSGTVLIEGDPSKLFVSTLSNGAEMEPGLVFADELPDDLGSPVGYRSSFGPNNATVFYHLPGSDSYLSSQLSNGSIHVTTATEDGRPINTASFGLTENAGQPMIGTNITPEGFINPDTYLLASTDLYGLAKVDGTTIVSNEGVLSANVPDTSAFVTKETADATYQPKGDYLTEVPAEYLTQTEGDAAYAAKSHTHQTADVTGLQGALDGKAAKTHTHTVSQITDFPEIPEAYAMATDAEASGLLGY